MNDFQRRMAERNNELQEGHARRYGSGLTSYFESYIGHVVYIEGLKMNHIGRCVGVLKDINGDAVEMLLHPMIRVGEWGREGPNKAYAMTWPTTEEIPGAVSLHAREGINLVDPSWLE